MEPFARLRRSTGFGERDAEDRRAWGLRVGPGRNRGLVGDSLATGVRGDSRRQRLQCEHLSQSRYLIHGADVSDLKERSGFWYLLSLFDVSYQARFLAARVHHVEFKI